jgi:hypothetical protein
MRTKKKKMKIEKTVPFVFYFWIRIPQTRGSLDSSMWFVLTESVVSWKREKDAGRILNSYSSLTKRRSSRRMNKVAIIIKLVCANLTSTRYARKSFFFGVKFLNANMKCWKIFSFLIVFFLASLWIIIIIDC